MLLLQFKRAEMALADGRLDEAWRIVSLPRVREHRRGQALLGRLLEAWLGRASEHLDHGRLEQAMQDYRRAGAIESDAPAVAALGDRVRQAIRERDRAAEREGSALRHAADRIAAGAWSSAHRILHGFGDSNGQAASLMRDLSARASGFERDRQAAEAALERSDWATAAGLIARLRGLRAEDGRIEDLRQRLVRGGGRDLEAALKASRTTQADALASVLRAVVRPTDGEVVALDAVDALRRTRMSLAEGRVGEAADHAARAAGLMPEAGWIGQMGQELREATATLQRIGVGPLAGFAAGDAGYRGEAETAELPKRPLAATSVERTTPELGGVEVLSIDGVGAYVLCRGGRTVVGPALKSGVDLPVVTNPSAGMMTFSREGEGYTLEVEGEGRARPVRDGERITFAPGTRLRFDQPHPASGSATVALLRGRVAGSDARQAILMDGQFVIGAGAQAHVRIDTLEKSLVVFARPDGLFVKRLGETQEEAQRLASDTSIEQDGLRMRLETLST